MPRKSQPQPEPTALDRLDPAPVTAPARNRRPPAGPREKGVRADLRKMPEELREGGIAAGIVGLAQDLDRGFVTGRDAAAHAREIRQGLMVLREMAPGDRKGDTTDDLRERRERRLSASADTAES
jgi:hypothetical protein